MPEYLPTMVKKLEANIKGKQIFDRRRHKK